jgi:hypothetical protein
MPTQHNLPGAADPARAAVLRAIAQAFADVAPPQPPLTPCGCCECAEIGAFLDGKAREDFSYADTAIFGASNLHLVSLPAVQYYMPLILERALAPEEFEFRDTTLYYLSYPFETDPARLAQFSASQRESVAAALAYLEDEYLADRLALGDTYLLELAQRLWRMCPLSQTPVLEGH